MNLIRIGGHRVVLPPVYNRKLILRHQLLPPGPAPARHVWPRCAPPQARDPGRARQQAARGDRPRPSTEPARHRRDPPRSVREGRRSPLDGRRQTAVSAPTPAPRRGRNRCVGAPVPLLRHPRGLCAQACLKRTFWARRRGGRLSVRSPGRAGTGQSGRHRAGRRKRSGVARQRRTPLRWIGRCESVSRRRSCLGERWAAGFGAARPVVLGPSGRNGSAGKECSRGLPSAHAFLHLASATPARLSVLCDGSAGELARSADPAHAPPASASHWVCAASGTASAGAGSRAVPRIRLASLEATVLRGSLRGSVSRGWRGTNCPECGRCLH
jgi:hypothetical protein